MPFALPHILPTYDLYPLGTGDKYVLLTASIESGAKFTATITTDEKRRAEIESLR